MTPITTATDTPGRPIKLGVGAGGVHIRLGGAGGDGGYGVFVVAGGGASGDAVAAAGGAFHWPLMEPMLAEFTQVVRLVTIGTPAVPIVSNVTGAPLTAAEIGTPGYWVRHARQPVRFYDGMRWLGRAGVTSFLELGPGGVLTALSRDCLAESGLPATMASTLSKREPEARSLVAAAELHAKGMDLDWAALLPDQAAHGAVAYLRVPATALLGGCAHVIDDRAGVGPR